MADRIWQAVDGFGQHRGLRQVLDNPYVYGANVTPTILIRNEYQKHFTDCTTLKQVAALDTETDVIKGTDEIILISLTFKDKVFTGIQRSFLETNPGLDEQTIERVSKRVNELLEKQIKERNINIEFYIGDSAADITEECMKRAHQWKPDFISIWNIAFDIPKMEQALSGGNLDLAAVFSDPEVPTSYKHYQFNPGRSVKETHDGRKQPIPIEDRWPTVDTPASFYFIDAMCLYAKLRKANGKQQSYALDNILKQHIDMGKLKFSETDHLSKLDWHIEMQKNYKFEYIAYNIFDCIGLELLDESTQDISAAFTALAGISDWHKFNSDPTMIADDLHFYLPEKQGYVVGTSGGSMATELDEYVIGYRGWIVTLNAYMAQDIGINIIKELPHKKTMISIHNADLDIESTYPSVQDGGNMSKETTVKELVDIEGVIEKDRRKIGINLSAGPVNACEFSQTAFNLADKVTLLDKFISSGV